MNRLFLKIFICGAGIIAALPAQTNDSPPKPESSGTEKIDGWYLDNAIGLVYTTDPVKLGLDTKAFYRFSLWRKDKLLWKNTRLDLGFRNLLSPAFDTLGLHFYFEPIAFFDIAGYLGYIQYYRGLKRGYFRTADPRENYESDYLVDFVPNESRGGIYGFLKPTLKAAVGPVAVVDSLTLSFHFQDTDEYFYDFHSISIHKSKDWDLVNDLLLLYHIKRAKLRLGGVYKYTRVPSVDHSSHVLGGMGIWLPKVKKGTVYLVLQLGLHLKDRVYKNKFYGAILLGYAFKMKKK